MRGVFPIGLRRIICVTLVSALSLLMSNQLSAHEIRPAIADVTVSETQVTFSVTLPIEPLIVGMNLSGLADTNDSPLADQHDALRALSSKALADAFRATWPQIQTGFVFQADGIRLTPEIITLDIPDVGDIALARDTRLMLRAPLPPGDSKVTIGWSRGFGPLILRQTGGGEDAYAGYLKDGELSTPLPRNRIATESAGAVVVRYTAIGFEHIVPKGLDHILFVLGLFFFSLALRPLLYQVTSFTLAHTVTLALASLGVISIPAAIVEPLIAVSIIYVAVENIFGGKMTNRRLAVVFMFGLLHGLGFASVLGDIGLDPTRFVIGLISFNIGVELGQIAVITGAFLIVGFWFGKKPWYRSRITIPVSTGIGLTGLWWAIERTFL